MTGKKIITIIVLIIAGLGLLAGGFWGGVLYQHKKNKPLENAIDPLKCLSSSKIIYSIIANGKVTKISGRTVTLSNGTENFSVSINEDVQVYSFTPGNQTSSSFEAIKIGDNLNVSAKVLSDGQLEVLGVIIISF